MLDTVLVELGLTKNEVKVYLALLKLGSGTVLEITKVSKVHRVNVYDVLERLSEKGLISNVVESDKRIYSAANPEQFTELLKEKEMLLSKVLPELKNVYNLKKEKQQVQHFFGPDGVMRAYYMMLEQNAKIFGIGGSGLNRKYLAHRHELWNKERLKRKITGQVLYYESSRNSETAGWNDKTMEIRYIPDTFKTNCMIDICGDLVINLIPVEEHVAAIVIENKTLADSYRQIFSFMWGFAKK